MPRTKPSKTTNNFISIKNSVKNQLKSLPNYTTNEEVFLIEEATNLKKEKLYLQDCLTPCQIKKINKVTNKRLKGMPLNKIFKRAYFFGMQFFVNKHVLAPRKETELLVEKAIQKANEIKNKNTKILDLCCGSGAIGLSLAKTLPESAQIVLSDISNKALKVCKKNAQNLGIKKRVRIVKSNLFCGLKNFGPFDIIVSNPPYVPTGDIKELDVSVKKYDPILALDGKEDGLYFYKEIAKKSKEFLTKNGIILLEFGIRQGKSVKKILEKNGFFVKILKDYSNKERIALATLRG